MKLFCYLIKHGPLTLLSLALSMLVIAGALFFYMSFSLPRVSQLRDIHLQVPLRIFTADNKLLAEFGEKRRIPVSVSQAPKLMVQAVLDTEDHRFYEHPGVDFIGLMRATKMLILTGKKTQGASTITMQVARNFFLTRKKTFRRKFNEILLAIKIDHEFTKKQILKLYLNKIYLGQRAYGIAAAAQIYYGKTLDQLTLPQMAMIAGLPQAPSRDNPISNPKGALYRRNHVLARMHDYGSIDDATYQQAVAAPVSAKLHQMHVALHAPFVAEMCRRAIVAKFGDNAYEEGYKVYTTINSKLQKQANRSLQQGLIAYDMRHGYRGTTKSFGSLPDDLSSWQDKLKLIPIIHRIQPAIVTDVQNLSANALLANGNIITIPWSGLSWARPQLKDDSYGEKPQTADQVVAIGDLIRVKKVNNSWQLMQLPQAEGALVALNPQNGAIQALTGGFSYLTSKFNRALQADRQTGSSFKPFIYTAALDKGFTLASIINDAPIVMADTGENSLWRPENDTQKFYGPTRLRIALIKSRNLVSIRLLQAIGIPYAIDYLQRFGFAKNILPNTLSLALGTAEISPLNLAAGYAVFANGGYKTTPFLITQIQDENNNVVYQANPATVCNDCDITNQDNSPRVFAQRVIPKQTNYLINSALKDVIEHGTGKAAKVLKRHDLAGKTGTTNEQKDAWFAGFNSHIVTTVWVGFDDPKSLHEYGAQAALPIWINFMGKALKGIPETHLSQPDGIITVRIDPKTGLLAYPGQKNAIFEQFRRQFAPTQRAATLQATTEDSASSEAGSSTVELF